MARKSYHVTKGTSRWKVKGAGNSKASATANTKAAAVSKAKSLAKAVPKGQVVIHGKNGRIQTEHTYVGDHHPPKG